MGSDTLSMKWSKREQDFMIDYPRSKSVAHLVDSVFSMPRWHGDTWGASFIEELEARGYDTTTLRFSVKLRSLPSEEDIDGV